MGLRRRVIVAFAFGALALSTSLAILTYQFTKGYLLDNASGRSWDEAMPPPIW